MVQDGVDGQNLSNFKVENDRDENAIRTIGRSTEGKGGTLKDL